MPYPLIQSVQNSKIKWLYQLHKSHARKQEGLILIEGKKEISLALRAGIQPDSLFFYPRYAPESWIERLPLDKQKVRIFEVSEEAMQKIAYRLESGVVMTALPPVRRLEDLQLSPNPLLIVVEAVEKPGNLGAILRTADAAAVDALIVCDPQTDLFNPNVIRSSLGCIFTVPTLCAPSETVIAWLKKRGVCIYTAALNASIPYHTADFTRPSALVFGTEATGLSDTWLQAADQNIIIPMSGYIDSLNVSNACAIITFEAKRQRGFKR